MSKMESKSMSEPELKSKPPAKAEQPPMTKPEPLGTIYTKAPLMLTRTIGKLENPDVPGEILYHLSVSLPLCLPIIYSVESGETWTIDWQRLLALAFEEGFNKERDDDA